MEDEDRWLHKQKAADVGQLKPGSWDHRYFRVVGSELQYFDSPLATKPRNVLALQTVKSVTRTSLAPEWLPPDLAPHNLWGLLVVIQPPQRLFQSARHNLYLLCRVRGMGVGERERSVWSVWSGVCRARSVGSGRRVGGSAAQRFTE